MTKVRGQSVKFRKGKPFCQTLPNFTASKRSHVLGGSRIGANHWFVRSFILGIPGSGNVAPQLLGFAQNLQKW